MRFNRRDFLGLTSSLIATGTALPALLGRTARAAAENPRPTDRVLVVVQLTGGNDGLNTVVPFADENYRRLRPALHLADAKLHKLDDRIGLHPSLERLARMFAEGQAAVVQSVGYPNPNRSHFESMAIWQTAPSDAELAQGQADTADIGWLARTIDQRATLAEQVRSAAALRVGSGEMPRALMGCRVQIPSLSDLDQLRRRTGLLDAAAVERQRTAWQTPQAEAGTIPAGATSSAAAVQAIAEEIEKIHLAPAGGGGYPGNELAGRLRTIAELVKAGFPTPLYFTELGGFDTHNQQLNRHGGLLETLASALAAFVGDLKKNVPDRPVLVLVFSEFGRRAAENASRGTDHGTAAPVFLLGDGIVPGVHGPYPDLANLVDGDPVFGVDFRAVYATILDNWLGLPSEKILGKQFAPLGILEAKA